MSFEKRVGVNEKWYKIPYFPGHLNWKWIDKKENKNTCRIDYKEQW